MAKIHRSVASLMAGRTYSCTGDWSDYTLTAEDADPLPTLADLQAEEVILQAGQDAYEYAVSRRKAYPPHNEMIEALWEFIKESRPERADAIALARVAIKALHPKP